MNKFFAAACLLAVFTMPARAEKINLVADDRVCLLYTSDAADE